MSKDYVEYDESDVEGFNEEHREVAQDERFRELIAIEREVEI